MTAFTALLWLALVAEPDLKAQARALLKTTGCKQVGQCRALPVGSRPCGGPSEFLVYCSATTDQKKLDQKVKAATDAEKALNATNDLMSVCSVLSAPKLKLEKGACKADEGAADVPK